MRAQRLMYNKMCVNDESKLKWSYFNHNYKQQVFKIHAKLSLGAQLNTNSKRD